MGRPPEHEYEYDDGVEGAGGQLPVRHAARVLLVDEDDRVLLFRSQVSPRHGHAFWYPVGGAVEPGEDAAAAVRREAREETGLAGLVLGPEVLRRCFVFHWHDFTWDARERWWLTRVTHFEPVFDAMEPLEADEFSACRWMSLEDLRVVRAGGDALTPANLLELLPGLLAGEIADLPLEVGE